MQVGAGAGRGRDRQAVCGGLFGGVSGGIKLGYLLGRMKFALVKFFGADVRRHWQGPLRVGARCTVGG